MIQNICTLVTTSKEVRAAVDSRKLWRNGSKLSVYFMNGIDQYRDEVMEAASIWSEYANIEFARSESFLSHIRVSFIGVGAWSYYGNDALSVATNEPTMVLASFHQEPSREMRVGTALHEFGHALGMIHEHLSPAIEIPWDEQKVFAYYRDNFHWDAEMVRHNVLDKPRADKYTDFDKYSIMLYPIDKELTTNGFEVPWTNTTLSELDKQLIKRMYPHGVTYR